MTANFIHIAEFVFDEIDDILDLLPLRAVARGIKHYADRRICQLILQPVSTEPQFGETSDIGGTGVIRFLSYDDPLPLLSSQTLVDYESDTAVTYGDMLMQVSDNNGSFGPFSEGNVDFVASQVIVKADQSCKIRFRPRSSSAFLITSRTYLQYFCLSPTGPRHFAKMLDSITIEPDAHQQEGLREMVTQFGSSFGLRHSNAQAVADDPTTLSMIATFTELPFPQSQWVELIYLDAPVSLLLRGSPGWEPNPEEDGNDSDIWYDHYDDVYRGWNSDRDSYDIDNDSDFWRRMSD